MKGKLPTTSKTVTPKTIQNEPKNSESQSYTIDDDNKELVRVIKSFKDSDYSTLIISGGVGTGKTYLARSIYPDYYFVSEPQFKQLANSGTLQLKTPKDGTSSIKLFPLSALLQFSGVIYDDLGCSVATETYIDKMLYWLQRVDIKGYKTIITTNLTLSDMKAYDDRIFSRLMLNAMVVVSKGKDRRLKQTKIIQI